MTTQNHVNLNLNKISTEKLEISSTGYGLESISEENKQKSQKAKHRNSSCGGL